MTEDLALVHRHVPADADGPAPAVVVLHGRGADEDDLLPVAERLPGDRHVLSARAPDRLGPGYSWYELDLSAGGLHESQPDAAGFARSRDLLDEFVDEAVEGYPIDPERVGVLGFSQGAILGLATVLERPDAFAWCAALHGYLAESHADLDRFDGVEGFPVFLGAGEMDQVIPASRAERAADLLAADGLDVTFEAYPTGHGIGAEEAADLTDWVGERDA
jgi:phospholipase/carboxylesterase